MLRQFRIFNMVWQNSTLVLSVLIVVGGGWLAAPAQGQTESPKTSTTAKEDSAAAREKVLESDRWKMIQRDWNHWLSIQQSYSGEEVAAIKSELATRIDNMSADQLEVFLQEMEDRLDVLLSPEAEEARDWLAQVLSVKRNPEEQRRRKRADVVNMTASEIRQELRRFQQQRAATAQSQAAFSRDRATRADIAQRHREDRRNSQAQAQQMRSRAAANMVYRSRYAPRPENRPNHSDFVLLDDSNPVYTIGPWGTPIRWDPLHGHNR
jgi:hypothetical protein